MKAAVIVFPGSNCDRDMAVALRASGASVRMVWHGETELRGYDFITLPGGFAYGDYLRCGAVAARSPIMAAVRQQAKQGVTVLGVCNGFQILAESGLLPGVLMKNRDGKFICRDVFLHVENTKTRFTSAYGTATRAIMPVAHHDGNYFADDTIIDELESEGRVVFRYAAEGGGVAESANINGSRNNIAGIINRRGNVLGMMPHPERGVDDALGGTDGLPLFKSLIEALS